MKLEESKLAHKLLPDQWSELRKELNLFRAVEPVIRLDAVTQPSPELLEKGISTETLPAYTARHCYESFDKYDDDPTNNREQDLRLTKNLINRRHTTPLQAVSYTFDVAGTTKTLQAQWTRHKIGVGWSYRSTRYVEASGNNFVYPTYDYIDDKEKVIALLKIDEATAETAIKNYERKRKIGATKQDARRIMPVEFATDCSFFTNARALRHLFSLRLDKHAEWEIRRMSAMMLEIVMEQTPALFQDIYDQYFPEADK